MNVLKRFRELAAKRPWLIAAGGFTVGAIVIYTCEGFLDDTLLHQSHPFLYRLISLVHRIGDALIVAAIVSFTYDTIYHSLRFERPVRSVEKSNAETVERVDAAIAALQETVAQSTQKSDAQFARINQHLELMECVGVLKQAGVGRLWKRYHADAVDPDDKRINPELQRAIAAAIAEADTFLYISGRTLEGSISRDERSVGRQWMWSGIEQRLKDKARTPLELSFLLPDVFSQRNLPPEKNARRGDSQRQRRGPLQKEYAAFMAGERGHVINQTRVVAEFLANRLIEFVREHPAEVRFIDRPAPFFCVITEKRAFVENYLPNRYAGETFVTEYVNHSDFWQHSGIAYYTTHPDRLTSVERTHGFKSHVRAFVQLRNESSVPASQAVANYLARKARKIRNDGKFSGMKKRFKIGLANAEVLEMAFERHLEKAEAAAEKVSSTPQPIVPIGSRQVALPDPMRD